MESICHTSICKTYSQEILKRFNMERAHPVRTPMEIGLDLKKPECAKSENYPYRELIGVLLYLSVGTRQDLTHAVSVLSQFNDCPDATHWKACVEIFGRDIGC